MEIKQRNVLDHMSCDTLTDQKTVEQAANQTNSIVNVKSQSSQHKTAPLWCRYSLQSSIIMMSQTSQQWDLNHYDGTDPAEGDQHH